MCNDQIERAIRLRKVGKKRDHSWLPWKKKVWSEKFSKTWIELWDVGAPFNNESIIYDLTMQQLKVKIEEVQGKKVWISLGKLCTEFEDGERLCESVWTKKIITFVDSVLPAESYTQSTLTLSPWQQHKYIKMMEVSQLVSWLHRSKLRECAVENIYVTILCIVPLALKTLLT